MIPYSWLKQASERIHPHVYRTPLTHDAEQDVYIKWENRQVTGSFKARGALNKVLALQSWEQQRGLVAASAGNHGQGVAMAGQLVNAPVTIFVPDTAPRVKLNAIRSFGAEVHLIAGGYANAEQAGLLYAQEQQATWISPYNDGLVIAGQGTIGLEILDDHPELATAAWLVPISGGGLISGIGAAIKPDHLETEATMQPRLIGVQSAASPFFHALFWRGTQEGVQDLPTLADGLSGAVEKGSLTIPLVRRYVDDIMLVEEHEIADAIRYAWMQYGERIEGSAAVSLAAVITGKISDRPAVLVISGGNIQPEIHEAIVSGA